jgi:hypothetical protein
MLSYQDCDGSINGEKKKCTINNRSIEIASYLALYFAAICLELAI